MSKYREPSQPRERREQLLKPLHLVILALVSVGTLVMLLPSSQLLSSALKQPDRLTLKYLRLLVAARPNDVGSKLQLARALFSVRELDEAARIVDSMDSADPKLRRMLQLLRLEIHLAQFYDQPHRAEDDAQLRKRLVHELEVLLAERLSVEELTRLAASSLALGRPDLAARCYMHLAVVEPRQSSKWLLLAAQQLKGSAQPAAEGMLYDHLAQQDPDLRSSSRHALMALAAFTRADRGDEALIAARRYVERYPGNVEILSAAARLSLARGQLAQAGTYYDALMKLTTDPDEKLKAAKLAVSSLSGSGQMAAALHAVTRYLKELPDNPELLEIATRLGMWANRPQLSQKWGRSLLSRQPMNNTLLSRQLSLELAAGDIAAALAISRRLLSRRPGSVELRERTAQLAEWNNRPQEALREWAYLALHTGQQKYLERGLKLAPQLYEFEILAKLLAVKARHGRMSNSELFSLVQAYENIAEPEELVRILSAYLERVPDHEEAWQALAEVNERRGDLQAALVAWERKSRDFGSSITETTHRAELLWELHRPSEAYVLLRDALDHSGAANTHPLLTMAEQTSKSRGPLLEPPPSATAEVQAHKSFLKLLGELFWHSEPRPEQLEDYRHLWRAEALQSEGAVRFVLLAKSQGHTDEAIAIAESAFQRFHDVQFLLSAMDIAVTGERWKDLGRLIATAQNHIELLHDNQHYYHLLAAYYLHVGDYERVQRVYARIVALDPTAVAARAELLWLLIDHSNNRDRQRGNRNRRELARYLTEWRHLAENEPALWLPFATGWSMLGRSADAVAYYQREWTRRPLDHLWLLGYVATLDAKSRSSDARSLRRFALNALRPEAMRAAHKKSTPAEREVLNTYVELVRDVYGAGKGSRWLRSVMHTDLEPEVQTGLLAAWRSTGDSVVSNYWITDSRSVAETNPWGRFPKRPKPAQDPVQATLADAGPTPEGTTDEPPPAPLRVLDQDAAAGEDQVPEKGYMVSLEAGIKTVNDLVVAVTAVSARIFRGALLLGGQVGVNQLFLSGLGTPQDSLTEVDLSLYGMWRHRLGRLELGVGTNLRSDSNLVSGWLQENLRIFPGGTLSLGVHLNELAYDSRYVRINGARHRASLGLFTSVLGDGLISVQGNFYRYHTRHNEELAMGANGELDLGYRIRRVRPQWTVRLSGSYSHNFQLAATLPDLLGGLPGSTGDVLPASFASLGAGTRIEHRFPGVSPIGSGRVRYLADLWVGWLWPVNILGFELNGGIALALPRRQELSLTGFVANNRWLGPGQLNAGISLRYVVR